MQEQGAGIDPDRLALAFGLVVRRLRKSRGLTQERLAEFANVHPIYVSMVERGVNMPTLASAFAFAEALGFEPDALIRDVREALPQAAELPIRREARRRRSRSATR